MLKDITLGQFFPGNSIVHRLDPRMKLILTILIITEVFFLKSVISYSFMLLFIMAVIASTGIKPGIILRGLKPLIFIICFTGLLNVFYTPGTPIFNWYFITVTREGIVTGIFMVIRILMLVTGTLLLTYTTSPIKLTDGIERLLSPLKRVHVPVHEMAMMMTIALRFIPTLIEETDKIMSAQRARGADFDSGSIFKRAASLVPLLVPLFISAFRRADELAVAMECRCYRGGEGRTKLSVSEMHLIDFGALAVILAVGAVIGVLTYYGF